MELRVAGENALMIYFDQRMDPDLSAQVQHCVAALDRALGDRLLDLVPSYASVMVIFDPLQHSHAAIGSDIRAALRSAGPAVAAAGREIVLPVYYATECGPDLEALAANTGLAVADIIQRHSERSYRVYAIGFAPGFAYLGEVHPDIACPRHATPRAQVPAGSVAIADRQTAVYPAASPGGWNLIGRCPTPMFDPAREPPVPVAVGDTVRFEPVDREAYIALGGTL